MPLRALFRLKDHCDTLSGSRCITLVVSAEPYVLNTRYLSNNEHVIQRIADSYPMRRAAQIAAYLVHRGKEAGQENFEKLHESSQQQGRKLYSFLENFKKQVQDGMKQIEENNKKKR